MGYLKVWIDSSHRAGDGLSCAGYCYHCPEKKKRVSCASEVFETSNSNDAELLGIYLALKAIYEKYKIREFKVFNDSIIATSMIDSKKEVSKKTLDKHPTLKFIRDYFKEEGILVSTQQINRTNQMMKIVDKKSKEFRKQRRYK